MTTELDNIANSIKAEVGGILTACRTALVHAKNVGTLLRKAKKLVEKQRGGKGGWELWVKNNCPGFGKKTARNYMKLSEGWGALEDHPEFDVATGTITDALRLLAVEESDEAQPKQRKAKGGKAKGDTATIPVGYRVSLVPRPGFTLEGILNVLATMADLTPLEGGAKNAA